MTPEKINNTAAKYRIDHYGDYDRNSSEHTRDLIAFANAIAAAARAEAIEECAKVCDGIFQESRNHLFRSGATICAGYIRALLNTGEKT